MQFPRINMNGSSPLSLISDICDANHKLREAYDALAKCTPHGRDYQTISDPTVYTRARSEHIARLAAIQNIIDDMEKIGINIDNQATSRR